MCVANSTPCVCFGVATFSTVKRGGAAQCRHHLNATDIILAIRLTFTCHAGPKVHRVNTGLR